MSCTLTGILKDCQANMGGLKSVYLIRKSEIASYTYKNKSVKDGIELINTNSPFKEYQSAYNTANYSVSGTITSEFDYEFTHTLVLRFNKRTLAKHKELFDMCANGSRVVALVKDGNERWWVLGLRNGMKYSDNSGGSSTSKGEGSNYNITLTGISDYYEVQIDENIVIELI